MQQANTKPHAPNAPTPAATSASHASASRSTATKSAGAVTTAAGTAHKPLTLSQSEILDSRGIDLELAVRMGWRSAPNDTGDAIEIPYFRDGKEVNVKTRTLSGEKRFFQVADADKCLYNLDVIKELDGKPLVITEGEMDCMVALQCGFPAVSVPDGAPKEAIGDKETSKYEYLRDVPPSVKSIILATDGDNPGINLMNDLALRLGKHRCMWVRYPQGCKDLNDTFVKYGERGVTETFKRAQFIRIEGLYRLGDLPPIAEQQPLSVGIPALEANLRLRLGDLSVVTGIPSHGKSTMINHVTYNMASMHGWHVCFASFEQPPQTEHRRALQTLYHGCPAHMLSEQEILRADEWIHDHFSFIVPADDSDEWFDMRWLLDRMAAAVTQNGAKMIVIDPWNELDHMFDNHQMSLTQYVGTAIKQLKRFARRFNVHVMVIAHPAKMRKEKDGTYPIPTAYDISDSSHWYNKPEQVLVVYRKSNGNTLLRVAKSRYHYALGEPGDVELVYDRDTGRFEGVPDKPRYSVAEKHQEPTLFDNQQTTQTAKLQNQPPASTRGKP